MACPTNLNPARPLLMHIDLNSAFAAMEQQANPLLRGVPLVVAAYNRPYGCILASSKEAKLWGVKTGMTVQEGQSRCPFLVVREADPHKYRHIHQEIKSILSAYTDRLVPKSIDEFLIDLSHTPSKSDPVGAGMLIQQQIRDRIGEWLAVSVGLGPSRFLAKLASDLKHAEPAVIDYHNLTAVYSRLTLSDLPGINWRFTRRLQGQGIFTPLDFLHADALTLKAVFRSVLSRDWYLRLRGWEVDDWQTTRASFGQSYVLPRPMPRQEWLPILGKLADKAGRRMRSGGYGAQGVHLYLGFNRHESFHRGHTGNRVLFSTSDLLALTASLIPPETPPVKHLAVTFFDLSPSSIYQCSLLENTPRRHTLTKVADSVNERFGPYTLHLASMLGTEGHVRDAIAFGK